MEGCFSCLGYAIDEVLGECGLPRVSREGRELLSFYLLRNVARTHSGGVTFQALQLALDLDSTLIVPQSSCAPPLRILLSVGVVPQRDADRALSGSLWGLRCSVQAVTLFNLKALRGELDVDASIADLLVRAVYEDHFVVPVTPGDRELDSDAVASAIRDNYQGAHVTLFKTE
jgi:hypothetical protein